MSSTPLSGLELGLALVGPLCILALAHHLKLKISKRIVVTLLRTIVQLLLAGYVLLGFIFSMQSPVYVLGYLLLMVVISSFEVTSRQVRTYSGYLWDSFVAVLIGGGGIGMYGSCLVFHTVPWWQPHIMVPTAGMLIGNSISGPSLGVDRLFSDVCDRSHEVELRLAVGGSKYEAILPTIRAAMLVALTPNMNQMAVVGIISIPGMMTGQLLAGASPLVAAEYQLVILWLIFTTVGLSTLAGLYLALQHAVFDSEHRLTLQRISKKAKSSFDVAVSNALMGALSAVCGCCSRPQAQAGPASELSPLLAQPAASGLDAADGAPPAAGVIKVDIEDIKERGSLRFIPTDDNEAFFQVSNFNVPFLGQSVPFFCESISFSLRRGEVLALEGPSGVGKTMFLRSLALFNRPQSGVMSLGGRGHGDMGPMVVIAETGIRNVPTWRKRCMYVPQAIPPLNGTPIDFIEEAMDYGSRCAPHKDSIRAICSAMERDLLLGADKLSLEWVKLSGGERQRAAIACALILVNFDNEKLNDSTKSANERRMCDSVVLLDEPTAACDPVTAEAVEAALLRSGATIVLTTHDHRQSARIADRRMVFTRVMTKHTEV